MTRFIGDNWFYLILPVLLAAAWSLSISPEAITQPQLLEGVYLFDFAIGLPALYFLFLRKRMSLQAALLGTLALAGTGLWFASWLMPAGKGEILPWLAWLRYVALPALIIIELVAAAALLRYAYGEAPDENRLIEQGMPPLLARAILAEARFWRRIWARMRKT